MSRPETTIFGSLSSQPASEARSLGDFSRMSNPPPSGGGEWDPSQGPTLGWVNPLAFRRSLQEAWGYTAEVSEYRKSSHAVYRLRYHFVFITKYRKPALRGEIGKEVRDLTREICRSLDIEIVKGHVRPDHVHLLLDVPPRLAPSRVMQAIKGKTSHHLLQDHRKLRKKFWGRHLWARGYFVATTGNVSDTMVAEYIETQDVETRDDDFRVTE